MLQRPAGPRTLRAVRSLCRFRSFVLRLAAASALVVLAPVARAADEQTTMIGGVDVVAWSPASDPGERLPLVVFSHAMHMCPTQSRYLTQALADAGYFVVAPRHADSNCTVSVPGLSRFGWKPAIWWSESDFRDRADDVRRVVDAMRRDEHYAATVDADRIALVGHSLGGYTVLGLGGAWPSWKLPGVRAILALTPYSLPFQRSGGLSKLGAPVMYQAGTLDPVFTLPIELSGYDQTPAPKYFVEFSGAAHLAWTDWYGFGRDAIVDYALAFVDHYVKGTPASRTLETKLPGVLKFAHAAR
jgi:predicted dienelactone hydrolase